jgi:nanoRNase/pAp phosphatase (c-di-AMP/oligoRNAs hydrolase)
MDNSVIQKIREVLAKNDNIVITLGKNPSIDEMAAALSLYLLLKEANKKVSVACPTQPIVELSNLVGIDKVQNKLDSQEGDVMVSFPYVEGEIEKVSYTLENGYLNIVVKAAKQGLTFDEKDVKYTKGGGVVSVLFVIGTPRLSDLGDLINPDKIQNTKIINIDNKQENQGYGDIVAVSPKFSSVSEQVADIVLSLGFRIDKDVAQNLLSGITYATKNFQEANTSPLAFEIASLLMRNGANRQSVTPHITPLRQSDQRHAQELQFRDKQDNPAQKINTNEPQNNQSQEPDDQKAPTDWLAPKVYKGSSNF